MKLNKSYIFLAICNNMKYIKNNSILISYISDLLFREVTNHNLIFILESKKVRVYFKSLSKLTFIFFQEFIVKIVFILKNFNDTVVKYYKCILSCYIYIVYIYRWLHNILYDIVNIYSHIINIFINLVHYYRPYLNNIYSIVDYYKPINNLSNNIEYFFNPIKLNGGHTV